MTHAVCLARGLACGVVCSTTLRASLASNTESCSKSSFLGDTTQGLLGKALQKSAGLNQVSNVDRHAPTRRRKAVIAEASGKSAPSSGDSEELPVAPLSPESPTGQFITELLQSHPHLVSAAVEQQLDQLAADLEDEAKKSSPDAAGNDLVLYQRISDVRAAERVRAVQEVMYALVVQKFIEAGAPLLPHIPFSPVGDDAFAGLFSGLLTSGAADQDKTKPPGGLSVSALRVTRELEAVHSEEALEMVREHLSTILGGKPSFGPPEVEDRVLMGTSKMRLGQIYAASIMYGYFLRRVDQRFQLEKSVRALMGGGGGGNSVVEEGSARAQEWILEDGQQLQAKEEEEQERGPVTGNSFRIPTEPAGAAAGAGGRGMGSKGELRSYVMSFDQDTLQRTATIRSKESVNVIESHTEALFGRPEIISSEEGIAVVKDDAARISITALRRTILEAVAFGSFLWDVESHVDARVKITSS